MVVVVLAAGLRNASAQPAEQPSTDGSLVTRETNTGKHPSSSPLQDEKKAEPPPGAKPERWQDDPVTNPCMNIEPSGATWLDKEHAYVEKKICEPAAWLDHYFANYRVLQDVKPGTFMIWRNALRWTEGGHWQYLLDYHLEWQLPQWEKYLKKTKLYFNSSGDTTKYTTLPGQPVNPGVDPATGAAKSVVGVRTNLSTRPRSLTSLDSGVKLSIHPDAFVRMRYEFSMPVGEVSLARFSETAMYQSVEHFTNTVQVDLERMIGGDSLARWSNYVTYLEGTAGITWNTGVSLITQLTPKTVISYDANVWGVNHPEWTIQNYRVGTRYRLNFYRPWLFLELEPEVTLPKDATGKRNPVFAFMTTLEIQFGQR